MPDHDYQALDGDLARASYEAYTETSVKAAMQAGRSWAYPHCDQRVLHAPGECQYCDQLPDWQHVRGTLGITFTGHEPTQQQPHVCPADLAVQTGQRGDVNAWPGNRAARAAEQEQ